jgi:hypothetical protein
MALTIIDFVQDKDLQAAILSGFAVKKKFYSSYSRN